MAFKCHNGIFPHSLRNVKKICYQHSRSRMSYVDPKPPTIPIPPSPPTKSNPAPKSRYTSRCKWYIQWSNWSPRSPRPIFRQRGGGVFLNQPDSWQAIWGASLWRQGAIVENIIPGFFWKKKERENIQKKSFQSSKWYTTNAYKCHYAGPFFGKWCNKDIKDVLGWGIILVFWWY